jgi:hypothetical protein
MVPIMKFTEGDYYDFLKRNIGICALRDEYKNKEVLEFDNFGRSEVVPLVFIDSTGRNGAPNKVSRTPLGKIVFPGPEMNLIETGVLYFLGLIHRRGPTSSYCITKGMCWRTAEYWRLLRTGSHISAIKECRSNTNLGLMEAKALVDWDKNMMLNLSRNPTPPVWISGSQIQSVYPSPSTPSSSLESLLNKRITELENLVYDQKNEVKRLSLLGQTYKCDLQDMSSASYLKDQQLAKLEEALRIMTLDFIAYVKKSQTISTVSPNVWNIISLRPTDDKTVIKHAIKTALKLYHPDRINGGGPLLVDLAGSITRELLQLSNTLK